jgi:2-iminoacetate synthase
MTLKEFLVDYSSYETRSVGEKFILEQIEKINNNLVKEATLRNLEKIESGKRDFYF